MIAPCRAHSLKAMDLAGYFRVRLTDSFIDTAQDSAALRLVVLRSSLYVMASGQLQHVVCFVAHLLRNRDPPSQFFVRADHLDRGGPFSDSAIAPAAASGSKRMRTCRRREALDRASRRPLRFRPLVGASAFARDCERPPGGSPRLPQGTKSASSSAADHTSAPP
jgi:hypothetical protein